MGGGGNTSLVVEVTSVRARIRFRDYEGCSGLIFVFFFSFDSYFPQLSKSVFKTLILQKLRKLRGSIPHRSASKL